MTYATQANLTERFGEAMLVNLTDRAAVATGQIDPSVIARALTDADALIDGKLGTRYILPLATVPPLVIDIAMKLAIYSLHITEPDKKITKDYDDALKLLAEIGSGAVRIPAAGIEPASSGASGVMTTDRARPFTEETMKGFI
ncbi:gp436 family protein [Cypionkella psychrotolerans]|uniref:gp436 family protein n=1 Tax=Cypionkella psychrotolerans TaxID=1678131 RepID=UPI0006B41E09|nr:DUF1320 domain-containing protein [Cypionkella psychrotolerans]